MKHLTINILLIMSLTILLNACTYSTKATNSNYSNWKEFKQLNFNFKAPKSIAEKEVYVKDVARWGYENDQIVIDIFLDHLISSFGVHREYVKNNKEYFREYEEKEIYVSGRKAYLYQYISPAKYTESNKEEFIIGIHVDKAQTSTDRMTFEVLGYSAESHLIGLKIIKSIELTNLSMD